MEAYLEKILDKEVLITLFAAFVLGRIWPRGRKVDSLSPAPLSHAEIEAKLKRVTLSKWMEVDAELDARRKIRAIKVLREATGLGLKDAREAVEDRQRKRDLRHH